MVREFLSSDIQAVEKLFARSYKTQLKDDYAPRALEEIYPVVLKISPDILALDTYYVAEEAGKIIGAGGWSEKQDRRPELPEKRAYLRRFATDPDHLRRGIGSEILLQCIASAKLRGFEGFDCFTTRTAVPFFRNRDFILQGEVQPVVNEEFPSGFPMTYLTRDFYSEA